MAAATGEEMFVSLGVIGSVRFFQHVCVTHLEPEQLYETAAHVFNALIEHTLIEKGQSLVVFNLDPATYSMVPVAVDHASSPFVEFPDGELQVALRRLYEADRSKDTSLQVVAARIANGRPVSYAVYELPLRLKDLSPAADDVGKLQWKPLVRFASTKPHREG